MIKKTLILAVATVALTLANAGASIQDDIKKLKNDKEMEALSIREEDRRDIIIKYWNRKPEIELIAKAFNLGMEAYLTQDNVLCEQDLIYAIKSKFAAELLKTDKADLLEYYRVLRIYNKIDNILYDILVSVTNDVFGMKNLDLDSWAWTGVMNHESKLENNDLTELFSDLVTWPDEKTKCSYDEARKLHGSISIEKERKRTRNKYLKILTRKALEQDIISKEIYHRLEYLRTESELYDRPTSLEKYLKITFNAKNKMVTLRGNQAVSYGPNQDHFSTGKEKRKDKFTQRQELYRKYDETQIVMLAQVLQKAARRMGSDPDVIASAPFITQEFSILNPAGGRDTYVERIDIDPQSQYNLARRLLRKDIMELEAMEIFKNANIEFSDVIMAAYETGYITNEDLEFVVKYDDLWNPHISKTKKIMRFVFQGLGYTAFFLPAPWNITASIAMTVVEGIIEKRQKDGTENDNPATFIE